MADQSTPEIDIPDEIQAKKEPFNMASVVDYSNIGRFYANHGQVNTSLFEIRLILNYVHGVNAENGHLMAMESMFVSLSPELARAVHNLLGRALEGYVQEYGAIRLPAALQAKVADTNEKAKRSIEMADALKPEESH